jgi:para-aminobenzoate synthetase component I
MKISLAPEETQSFIPKLLSWATARFPFVAYFTDNNIPYPNQGFKHCFFAGTESFQFADLSKLEAKEMVGILGYDLKNRFEKLQSTNPAIVETPESLFFLPQIKIEFSQTGLEILGEDPEAIFGQIQAYRASTVAQRIGPIEQLTDEETYIEKVEKIKSHIEEGDIYEMNFCMAFEAGAKALDPVNLYLSLNRLSPMPFSVFFKAEHQFLLCASPERFLQKTDHHIIAQPIKGTIKRGANEEEDEIQKATLFSSEKERAENLMIVDLMRNDLSKISQTGSVQVDELFGIYTFKNLHQMISTVSSSLSEKMGLREIIEATFPMGSMTGAPKIKCMELIERFENFRRGWFSGSVGYIDGQGNFDMNVIIRSLIYDVREQKLMFAVGSAITHDADPHQEYQECMLKASAIFSILEQNE